MTEMTLLRHWYVYLTTAYLVLALRGSSRSITQAGCTLNETLPGAYNSNPEKGYNCLNDCHCYHLPHLRGVSIICMRKNLDKVPSALPIDTVLLNLDDNKIENLTESDFKGCFKLKKLLLKLNKLKDIENKTFLDTHALTELHLNNNTLNISSYNSDNSGFFEYLQNLTALFVDGNDYIDDSVFRNLPNLNQLALDRTETVKFGEPFLALTKLNSITVHGTFNQIGNQSFENLRNSKVTQVIIRSGDTLSETLPLAFASVPHLETLDLSFNRGIGFDVVSNAWYGLNYTKISALKLTCVAPITAAFSKIEKSFYKYLKATNITSLKLNRNDIISMEKGLADAFPALERLNLSYNRLSQVDHLMQDMARMNNLRFADISYTTKRLPDGPTKRSLGLQSEPKYRNNSLTVENPNPLHNVMPVDLSLNETCHFAKWVPCHLSFLHKEEDKSTRLSDITPYGPWCILFPIKLESINLTSSLNYYIRGFPQTVLLGRNHHFREMVFRSNEVKEFRGPLIFANLSSSTPLSFDGGDNGASCFSPTFLTKSIERGANISRLILDGNDLGTQLDLDSNGSVFQDYIYLIELNLARNNIKTLHVHNFKNLENLRVLNLSSNSLRDVRFKFAHMRHLKQLDLSYNLLTDLSMDISGIIATAFASSNLTLNISGNPILCSCQTLPFLIWLNENKQHISEIEEIYCLINSTNVKFDNLEDNIIKPLVFHCQSNFLLIMCGVMLAIVTLGVITSICLYRHRWDIRYCFINFGRKMNMYQLLINQSRRYQYDAFVSYDKDDREWVIEQLIPNIDTTNSFGSRVMDSRTETIRLCIHERDFTPGEHIQEQIVSKIQESRKVLLILSRNFLRSHWCMFELEMSQVDSFERGWNIIVPIMMEQLSMDELPGSLQMLVRRQTYITWKSQLPDRNDFWIRLKNVLADSGKIPCACECQGASYESEHRDDRRN